MKKTKGFYLHLIVSFSFFVSILLPILFPTTASAAIQNVSAQRDRTILYALIRCLKDAQSFSFKDEVSSSDIRGAANMENIVDDTLDDIDERLPGKQMAVGYEIESDDGNADCSKMSLNRAMRPLDKTPRWFFEQIYDIKNDQSTHPRRSDDIVNNIAGKLNQTMGGRNLSIGKDERLRRLATAFWICGELAPTPPDGDTVTYGGKKYQKRDGAPTEVSVGYDMESGNGKFRCDTLLNWGDKAEMAEALSNNPEGTTPGSGGGTGPEDEQVADCDTKLLNPLSWIICPVIDIGANGSDYIFQNIVEPLLSDIPLSTDPNNDFFKAWQGFRFIANIILVSGMLGIVYSMARGDK